MKDYIRQALRTEAPVTPELIERMAKDARAIHGIFGLQTELGEFVDAYKRVIFYGKESDRTNVAEELGDLLWYIAILMDHVGVDFEQCMEANIAKLRKRYSEKFNEKEAIERDLSGERQVLEQHHGGGITAGEKIDPLQAVTIKDGVAMKHEGVAINKERTMADHIVLKSRGHNPGVDSAPPDKQTGRDARTTGDLGDE